jgi:hypothetical protein
MANQKPKSDESWREQPVAWFVALEIARQKNDFEKAAQAHRELKRLGVNVSFSSAPSAPVKPGGRK